MTVVMKEVFNGWMKMYGKKYETTSEYDERLVIFSQNMWPSTTVNDTPSQVSLPLSTTEHAPYLVRGEFPF